MSAQAPSIGETLSNGFFLLIEVSVCGIWVFLEVEFVVDPKAIGFELSLANPCPFTKTPVLPLRIASGPKR